MRLLFGKALVRPRRISGLAAGVLALVLTAGCVRDSGPKVLNKGVEQLTRTASHRTIKADEELRDTWLGYFAVSDPAEQQLLQSLLEFSEASFGRLADNWVEPNLLLSPASLYVDLAMLGEGTAGKTREEIDRVLAGSGYTGDDFLTDSRQAVASLLAGMNLSREHFTMRTGQSLWYRPDLPIREDYLNRLEKSYFAEAYHADFALHAALVKEQLGKWVSEKTAGLLGDDLPVEIKPSDVMYFLQSLYFKDSWQRVFDPDWTEDGAFCQADGTSQTVLFMHQTVLPGWGLEAKGFRAAELYTEQGFVFRVILPDEVMDLKGAMALKGFYEAVFSDHLAASAKDSSTWSDSWEVQWSMPKFDVKADIDLLDLLDELGIKDVRGESADFSRAADVAPGTMYLDQAKQQVRVKVDEKGVEAAAVTMFSAGASMPEIQGKLIMDMDRPFFFSISLPGGLPLFMGWVGEIPS